MSQVPGLGHVTSFFYSTLFHFPLVGVDKKDCNHSLNSTKENRGRGHEFPVYVPCVSQKQVVSSS
jgi:hypothetical protein